MQKSVMEKLCDIVNMRISENRSISDEQINVYLKQIFEYVRHMDSLELPHSFYLLRQTLFKKWEYGAISDLPANTAFILGALWGGAMLSDIAETERKKQPRLEALAKQNLKYYKTFLAINRHPGIKHKDLAELSGIKNISQLSQWIYKMQRENYFSFSRVGREKYYYMEKRGEELLQEMQRQLSAAASIQEVAFAYHKPFKRMAAIISVDNDIGVQPSEKYKYGEKQRVIETICQSVPTEREEEKEKWDMKKSLLSVNV